jgi:2-polyprenyl-3-methyl-5-hydroxy-6-metoxy-1,4-benzoquinol methylase
MPSDWQDVQRRFYDATADEYDENFQQANPYFAFVLDRFLEAVDPRPGERILELGASGGRFTVPLLDRGCRVTAVDISRRSIEYLERLTAGHPERGSLTLVEDDATTLSRVRGREFDAVVGGHILHHVPDVRAVATRALERLGAGGRAVFLEPNPWNPQWYVHLAMHPRRSWRVERGIVRVWPGRVCRGFEAAGFRACRVTTVGCFPPFVHNVFPATRKLEGWLAHWPPLARTFTLNVFVARKA